MIDLGGLTATSAVVNGSTLSITAGGQTFNFQVAGAGLSGNVFALENDQHGGTILALGKAAPVIFGLKLKTVFAAISALLGPISIADPGPGGSGILRLVISAFRGLLAANAVGAGTVSGDNSDTLTLTGNLADLNAELANVTYTGASAGNDTVDLNVIDTTGATIDQKIAVTTLDVPFTQPVLNVPSSANFVPGVESDIPDLSLSDPFAETTSQSLHLRALASSGSHVISGGSGALITNQNSNDVIVTGTPSEINSYLADGDALIWKAVGLTVLAVVIVVAIAWIIGQLTQPPVAVPPSKPGPPAAGH